MGLSAFSRARVSQLEVLELEAARFEHWNAAHQAGIRAQDDLQSGAAAEEEIIAIREADEKAVKTIGEKVVAGLPENTEEGEPIDRPLREDHVRDMVGRRHVVDPQGPPKSTLERLHDRIPTGMSASVKMVEKTDVDSEGPTKEEVEAAEKEQEPWVPPEKEEIPLPAAGSSAGVKGENVSPKDAATTEKKVPETTKVEPPKKTAEDETKARDPNNPTSATADSRNDKTKPPPAPTKK